MKEFGVDGLEVLDIGCGTGRIHSYLSDHDFSVYPVDTCDNCLEDDTFRHRFAQADILGLAVVDGGFEVGLCSDVMEHLPEEIIGDALSMIRTVCFLGAVIGISLLPDSGKLHCSVHDADWWEAKLKEHWPIVERREVPQLHPRQGPDSWGLWLCRKAAA